MSVFCFKQKTAYEMRIRDWSSDVGSSDLEIILGVAAGFPVHADKVDGDLAVLGIIEDAPVFGVLVADDEKIGMVPYLMDVVRQQIRQMRKMSANKIGRASCRERVCQYV